MPCSTSSSSSSGSSNVAPTMLATKNAHPRDQFIEFDEGPHIYTVHGEQGYTSVTTLNHAHFDHFDADACIDKFLSSRKWQTDPDYKYYKMTREEIKTMWSNKGTTASESGTQLHYDIECFYNGMDVVNDSPEFQFFLQFVRDFPELKPYRTEWMVYYEELKLAGSIDMIFENPDGTLQIYDWKRCEEIPYEAFGGKTAKTECIRHLPDSKFWHYTLQLNTYKTILEEKYGKKITGLYLVRLHPENPYKTYDRIDVPFLEKEMADLFALRRLQVEKQTNTNV